jgi:N utilization substance protein A
VVVNELRGEKIDVIRWSPDPSTYIANALSPARVQEVRLINPDERQAHVLVPDDQLSLAIGKEGQNVRLAARLTGWKIDIKDSAKYDYEAETRKLEAVAEERRLAREAAMAEEDDYYDEEEEFESDEAEQDEEADRELVNQVTSQADEEFDEDLESEAEDEVDSSGDGFGSAATEAFQRP